MKRETYLKVTSGWIVIQFVFLMLWWRTRPEYVPGVANRLAFDLWAARGNWLLLVGLAGDFALVSYYLVGLMCARKR